jgi:hypothetical protein
MDVSMRFGLSKLISIIICHSFIVHLEALSHAFILISVSHRHYFAGEVLAARTGFLANDDELLCSGAQSLRYWLSFELQASSARTACSQQRVSLGILW